MSEDPVDVQLAYQHGSPVFVARNSDPELERVFGFAKKGRTGLVTFPAFLPFVDYVIEDLHTVYGDRLQFKKSAEEYIETLPEIREAYEERQMPDGFHYVTSPFDHQKEEVERCLHLPHRGIFFDCGLGKTKTTIDLMRAIKLQEPDSKFLVVCPSHLPRNWAREFETHSAGELDVLPFVNSNNKTMSPEDRMSVYTGLRSPEPNPDTWVYREVSEDVLYRPLDPPDELNKVWKELLELERAYIENVAVNGPLKERQSLRGKMRRRAKKVGTKLTPYARLLNPQPRAASTYDVIIMSVDLIYTDLDLILKYIPFNVFIADESHVFRSRKSDRSKAGVKLAKRARRRYLLSGTPALGNPLHLYTQLYMLAPFLVDGWWEFQKRYRVTIKRTLGETKKFHQTVAFKNLSLLNEIVNEVATRRKAKDCLDLPPVRTLTQPVYVDDETKHRYNEMVRNFETTWQGEKIRVAHAADRLIKLFQILSGFIIDSGKNYELCDNCPQLMRCAAQGISPYTPDCVKEQEAPPSETHRTGDTSRRDTCIGLVDSILASEDNKVIIWCAYTEELNMLEEEIQKNGWDYVRVDGRTRDKVACEDKFQNDPNCRIYLAQIATGVGITLTAANYTIYYSVTFDLEPYEQSRKRNDRIGQTRPVTVYHLETPGSVNEYIFRALRQKQDVSATLTDHIRCALCTHNEKCNAENIKPFDEGCIYSDKSNKVSMQPALLK